MTILAANLVASAEHAPNSPALRLGDATLMCGQFNDLASRAASGEGTNVPRARVELATFR